MDRGRSSIRFGSSLLETIYSNSVKEKIRWVVDDGLLLDAGLFGQSEVIGVCYERLLYGHGRVIIDIVN